MLEKQLIKAVRDSNPKMVESLLAQDADANAINDMNGMTALMLAIYDGNLEIVKMLLKRGADVNARDGYGTAPLMFAILSIDDKIEIV